MASLSLKHIYKVYPNGAKAVNDFNMEIEDKEFIVFVGPSGCGKSTTLRMIAGLEDITAGELKIGDMVVNDVEPKDRDIAMVFQNYALYPHMTVYDNIAFGLQLRRMPKDQINQKVLEAAEILGITEYLGRKPKEMSGGQRQRVSLGRAIVREPKVMLLDEPLSNLDAKLRTQMRAEISKLHSRLNTTFIYVTHDQVEAMTMGTRIVVMKSGFVQQIDTPKNLYNYPGNKFVASFIGTPQMNFFEGTLLKQGDEVKINFHYSDAEMTVPYSYFYKADPKYLDGKTVVTIGVRAEDVIIAPGEEAQKLKVRVSHREDLGAETLLYGDINMEGDGYVESSTRIIIKAKGDEEYRAGDVIEVAFNLDRIHLFDSVTENSILPRIPAYNYIDCKVENGKAEFLGTTFTFPQAISCRDGVGQILIPTDGISLGGTVPAQVLSCEKINGKYVAEIELGDRRLYAVKSEPVEPGEVMIDFDAKKLGILMDGEEVVTPMEEIISIKGKFVKEKRTEVVDGKKKKTIHFFFDLAGTKFESVDEISSKIFAVLNEKDVFKKDFRYECSCYDFTVAQEGIPATVKGIEDYGKEQFAVCEVAGKTVRIAIKEPVSGTIHLVPDIHKLAIIQDDLDIRIV